MITYIALLRGINAVFKSKANPEWLTSEIRAAIGRRFGFNPKLMLLPQAANGQYCLYV